MSSRLRTIFLYSFIFNLLALLIFGGKIIDHTPFLDDIETISAGHFRYGLNYFEWREKKLWFRPIEYYVYALLSLINSVNLMVVLSFFCVALSGALGAIIVASNVFFQAQAYAYLSGLLLTLHPIIASPAFRISILSQCMSNLFAMFLLLQAIQKQRNYTAIAIVFIVGALSKESFLPYLLLSAIIYFLRDKNLKILIYAGVLTVLYLLARHAVIDYKLLAAVDRYHVGLGANVVKNLWLHLGGLAYFGSSPDLFTGNVSREWPSIAISLLFWLLVAFSVKITSITRVKIYILLFAGVSLFPGILTQGVAEHNISAFVFFAMLYVLYSLQERRSLSILLPLLILVISVSSAAIWQKTSLLADTIKDYRRMKAQAQAGQPVTCLRKFEKTYSFYKMNSDKNAGWYLVYDKPGLPPPACAPVVGSTHPSPTSPAQ